jgi:hypothetical protein
MAQFRPKLHLREDPSGPITGMGDLCIKSADSCARSGQELGREETDIGGMDAVGVRALARKPNDTMPTWGTLST